MPPPAAYVPPARRPRASRKQEERWRGGEGREMPELVTRLFHKYGSRLTLPIDVSDFYSSCTVPLVTAGPTPVRSRCAIAPGRSREEQRRLRERETMETSRLSTRGDDGSRIADRNVVCRRYLRATWLNLDRSADLTFFSDSTPRRRINSADLRARRSLRVTSTGKPVRFER